MLEKKLSTAVALKSRVKKEAPKSPTLIELIREDSELAEFIRYIRDNDLRQEAFEILKQRLSGAVH